MSLLIAFAVILLALVACTLVAEAYQAVYEYLFCERRHVLTPTGIPMDNLVEIHVFNKKTGELVRVIGVDNSMYQ